MVADAGVAWFVSKPETTQTICVQPTSKRQPRRAALIAATSIFFISILALSFGAASRQRLRQYARRDLPGDAPFVFAPAACALLPAIADDGVPIAIGLFLIVGGDLEREGFVMLEHRT